jgi:hypothetical protein
MEQIISPSGTRVWWSLVMVWKRYEGMPEDGNAWLLKTGYGPGNRGEF